MKNTRLVPSSMTGKKTGSMAGPSKAMAKPMRPSPAIRTLQPSNKTGAGTPSAHEQWNHHIMHAAHGTEGTDCISVASHKRGAK